MDHKSLEWHEHKKRIYLSAKMYNAAEYEQVIIDGIKARKEAKNKAN